MAISVTTLWIVYGVCCLPAVAWMLRLRLRPPGEQPPRWRQSRRIFAGACIDGIAIGLVIGIGLAAAVLAVGVLPAQLIL